MFERDLDKLRTKNVSSDNPGQNIWLKVRKSSKLDKTRKLRYLFFLKF